VSFAEAFVDAADEVGAGEVSLVSDLVEDKGYYPFTSLFTGGDDGT